MAISLTVPQRTGRVVASDLDIRVLGACRYPSPLASKLAQSAIHYVGQADRVLLDDRLSKTSEYRSDPSRTPAFELAGPRDRIFFDPSRLRVGIVTCGGLCPGINNVIRGLVLELSNGYGVPQIVGFRYGYGGLIGRNGHEPVKLTPSTVADIHNGGGTSLGTSRGDQDAREMVDRLDQLDIGILFVVGGDGTLRGAMKLVDEIRRRDLLISVVGIPKTIDNDIHFIDRSFGFESAYSAAVDVIRGAHVEATGANNGIAVVKLMGRHSGFIACHAAIASTDVDAVLIPEVPVQLEGDTGLFHFLERRLEKDAHAVIVVAEGAGQELCVDAEASPIRSAEASPIRSAEASSTKNGEASLVRAEASTVRTPGRPSQPPTDPSGNVRLRDIGVVLRDRVIDHFRQRRIDVTVKYVDPSYHIRSVPALPNDSLYCWNMARNAVHAAMAGNTEMLIGRWHGRFVHVPMPLATRYRKQVDTTGDLWMAVVESTGQPLSWTH
jgi:6-phosphofructokinase 1